MTIAPPIPIASFRPEVGGRPFPGTELPRLPDAITEAETWIDHAFETPSDSPDAWTAWPDRPEFAAKGGPVGLNTGAAGVAWFALAADRVLGGEARSTRLRRALEGVRSRWRAHADDPSPAGPGGGSGFYTGLAGIGSVLLGAAESDAAARDEASAVFDAILDRRGREGVGAAAWTGIDAVLGDSGVALGLLRAGERLGERRYTDAAAAFGEILLDHEARSGARSTWPNPLLDTGFLPEGAPTVGFEVGDAGIAFLLARLAVVTGDERFTAAARRGARGVVDRAVVAGDGAVVPGPWGGYPLGYCVGSSGVVRALAAVHEATGDPELLEWIDRFGRGILRSGVPGRPANPNLYVLHQCCGSAAVLETFLGLWERTGSALWLDAARAQGDDLLVRSVHDARGRRWYSEARWLPAGTLKAEVGYQTGASGIALALLRLHAAARAAAGADAVKIGRLPDDPYPETIAPAT